jgi:hypothetical protein
MEGRAGTGLGLKGHRSIVNAGGGGACQQGALAAQIPQQAADETADA